MRKAALAFDMEVLPFPRVETADARRGLELETVLDSATTGIAPAGYCPIDGCKPVHLAQLVKAFYRHPFSDWTGGHGTLPYVQNKQQSAASARSTVSHTGHSQKNWQLSVGISTSVARSHSGQGMVEVISMEDLDIESGCQEEDFGDDGNPALSVALVKSFTKTVSGSKRTTALGGLKVASTLYTPSTPSSAVVTVLGHAAQVIPSTFRTTC